MVDLEIIEDFGMDLALGAQMQRIGYPYTAKMLPKMKQLVIKFMASVTFGTVALLSNQAVANTVTWSFLEHGHNLTLGNSSTFTESGYSVTAYGFAIGTPDTASALYAKYTSGNADETGLGLVSDIGTDHEIDHYHFVQIDSWISPSATLASIWLGSVQSGENAAVYGSNTLGTLGTLLASVSSDGSVVLSSWTGSYRYFGVTDLAPTAPHGNALITSLAATTRVPDGGTTGLLLGLGLLGIGFVARRRTAV